MTTLSFCQKPEMMHRPYFSTRTVLLVFLCLCLFFLTFRYAAMPVVYLSSVPLTRDVLRTPSCVVNTCNDDWTSVDGVVDANQDNAGCSSVRSMIRMDDIKRNISGHWCKVYRAKIMCEQKRYRYFIFRDDDTRIDIFPLLEIAKTTGADMIASYKSTETYRVCTNWFLLDTHSDRACEKVQQWWSKAKRDFPEHDQKYFNMLFKCGRDGLHCIDKRTSNLNEIHCRSSLGRYRSKKRQYCLRYQTKPVMALM